MVFVFLVLFLFLFFLTNVQIYVFHFVDTVCSERASSPTIGRYHSQVFLGFRETAHLPLPLANILP